MYDHAPSGRRNGEPVADCFGILGYPEGAVLAVADGVNWGEPPRRAARCAVLGALQHMQAQLENHKDDSMLDSATIFRHLLDAVQVSQRLIVQQFGTLTTLVVSVVLPAKWLKAPRKWVAMTLTVGDSAAFCYRARTRTIEEVTEAAHSGCIRDARWCPGALGYALGEDPDLTNMILCMTVLEQGDFIFLTSDGVADNFDPVIRKLARHEVLAVQTMDSLYPDALPAISPAACQEMAMTLLGDTLRDAHKQADAAGVELTAQSLVEHLICYVNDVTEEHRQHMETRSRERERSLVRDLNTDKPTATLNNTRPPGKMDHATCVCYQVGMHRPGEGRLAPVAPPLAEPPSSCATAGADEPRTL